MYELGIWKKYILVLQDRISKNVSVVDNTGTTKVLSSGEVEEESIGSDKKIHRLLNYFLKDSHR